MASEDVHETLTKVAKLADDSIDNNYDEIMKLLQDTKKSLANFDNSFERTKDLFNKKEEKLRSQLDAYLMSIGHDQTADEFIRQNDGVYDKIQDKFRVK